MVKPWFGPAPAMATSPRAWFATIDPVRWPSTMSWTDSGVCGALISAAHPAAISPPGNCAVAAIDPVGSKLMVSVRQPSSGLVVPAPELMAYTHMVCAPAG